MRKPEQILLDASEELLELSIRHGKISVTLSILNELKEFAPDNLKQIATNALFAAIDSSDALTTKLLIDNYGAEVNGRHSNLLNPYKGLTPLELAVSTAKVIVSDRSLEELSNVPGGRTRNIVRCDIPGIEGNIFYDKDLSITDRYDVNENIIFMLVEKGAQVTNSVKLCSMQAVTIASPNLPNQGSSSNILDAAVQKHGNPFWNLLEKQNIHEGSVGRHIASFIGNSANSPETKRTAFNSEKAAEYWVRLASERRNIRGVWQAIDAHTDSNTRRFDTQKTPLWGNAR